MSIINPYKFSDIVDALFLRDDTVFNDRMRILKHIKSNHDIRISSIQHSCEMGYGKVAEHLEKLEEVGVIKKPYTYRMVVGEDGKRHRQYSPYELAVSDEDLQDIIEDLEFTYGCLEVLQDMLKQGK